MYMYQLIILPVYLFINNFYINVLIIFKDATISGTGEQVVLVGAASKGIIQRGFQHNAMVYKTPYAKNPFDAITDQELDQYKKEVERKQKGDPCKR